MARKTCQNSAHCECCRNKPRKDTESKRNTVNTTASELYTKTWFRRGVTITLSLILVWNVVVLALSGAAAGTLDWTEGMGYPWNQKWWFIGHREGYQA